MSDIMLMGNLRKQSESQLRKHLLDAEIECLHLRDGWASMGFNSMIRVVKGGKSYCVFIYGSLAAHAVNRGGKVILSTTEGGGKCVVVDYYTDSQAPSDFNLTIELFKTGEVQSAKVTRGDSTIVNWTGSQTMKGDEFAVTCELPPVS